MWMPPSATRAALIQRPERRDHQFPGRREDDGGIELLGRRIHGRPSSSASRRCRSCAGDAVDLRAPVPRHLDGHVRGGAEPVDPQPLAGLDPRHPQRPEPDNARAQQRRGVQVRETLREPVDERFRRHDVLGVAAVHGPAGEIRAVAEVLASRRGSTRTPRRCGAARRSPRARRGGSAPRPVPRSPPPPPPDARESRATCAAPVRPPPRAGPCGTPRRPRTRTSTSPGAGLRRGNLGVLQRIASQPERVVSGCRLSSSQRALSLDDYMAARIDAGARRPRPCGCPPRRSCPPDAGGAAPARRPPRAGPCAAAGAARSSRTAPCTPRYPPRCGTRPARPTGTAPRWPGRAPPRTAPAPSAGPTPPRGACAPPARDARAGRRPAPGCRVTRWPTSGLPSITPAQAIVLLGLVRARVAGRAAPILGRQVARAAHVRRADRDALARPGSGTARPRASRKLRPGAIERQHDGAWDSAAGTATPAATPWARTAPRWPR